MDPESSIVEGKSTVAPSEIKEIAGDLQVGDKIEIDFGGYGIMVYKESIKGRSSYRIIKWTQRSEHVKRYDREWKHFQIDGDSTFGSNLGHAFRECGMDPVGAEVRKDIEGVDKYD